MLWEVTPHTCLAFSVQILSPALYYYYVTELAFYWSLMFSQFTDIKRKVRGATQQRPQTKSQTFGSMRVWCRAFQMYTVLQAATVVVTVILAGHMFMFFGGRGWGFSVCEGFVFPARGHPLSCDGAGLILLELLKFHWALACWNRGQLQPQTRLRCVAQQMSEPARAGRVELNTADFFVIRWGAVCEIQWLCKTAQNRTLVFLLILAADRPESVYSAPPSAAVSPHDWPVRSTCLRP